MPRSSARSFDPAALFLLDWAWPNLFEPAVALPTNTEYRCKGCGAFVSAGERERHHNHHRRIERNRRARELQRTRERSLKLARKARTHQTEGRAA